MQTTTDPNVRPAVPGIRAATINGHGDIARADVTTVRDVYGNAHHIDREALAGSRVMLTRYRRDGRLMGRLDSRARTWTPASPLHRDNIAEAAP